MHHIKKIIFFLCAIIFLPSLALAMEKNHIQAQNEGHKNMTQSKNMILMRLTHGDVFIELSESHAASHAQRFKELVKDGFYDQNPFHRVIDGFMVQSGGGMSKHPGSGQSSKPNLKAEFNDIKHERGVLSMARHDDVNSANSQFFIMLANHPHLDGKYTAFGKVVSGMEHIDKIKKGESGSGVVTNPDKIISMHLVEQDTKADDMSMSETHNGMTTKDGAGIHSMQKESHDASSSSVATKSTMAAPHESKTGDAQAKGHIMESINSPAMMQKKIQDSSATTKHK